MNTTNGSSEWRKIRKIKKPDLRSEDNILIFQHVDGGFEKSTTQFSVPLFPPNAATLSSAQI